MENKPKDFDFSDLSATTEGSEQIIEQQLQDSDDINWDAIGQDLKEQKKYGDKPLEAAALSAASAATFSLSDRALQKLGIYSQKDLQQLRDRNPEADIAGTVAGIVAPALVTGGTSLPAKAGQAVAAPAMASLKAATAAEKVVEKALSKAIVESGQKSVAKEILKKSATKGLGSAVEGAAMGANQLLREDALGEADFNAENLMTHAGIGALYGGVIGAALPVAGAAVKAGTKNFGRLSKKAFDPVKDAADLTGLTPLQVAKMKSNPAGQNMLKELPDWYKTQVGLKVTDSADDIVAKVETLRSKSAANIDDVINKIDETAAPRIAQDPTAFAQLRTKLYREVANELEDKFYKPYAGMASFRGQNNKVLGLIHDLRKNARSRQPLSAAELREFRIKMDKLAKSFYEGHNKTESATAAFAARDLLKKSINKYAEFVDPKLATQLSAANKNYHYAESVLKSLQKRAAKDKDFVSFKDIIFGGVGYGLGDVAGLGVAAARKLLNSDFKRKVSVLSNIERANKAVNSKTSSAVKNFFTSSARPARMASVAALTTSTLSMAENGEKPKNNNEAFANISKNIKTLQQNPEEFVERLARTTSAVSQAAPMTAAELSNGLVRGVNFLASKLPNPRTEVNVPGLERPYQPSSMEMAKFQRYVQAIEAPLTILDEIESGTLTREHVEALREVYPNFYRRIQEQVMENMALEGQTVPYSKKVQLGILLDIPTDSSLLGKNIMALQSSFQAQEQAAAQGGAIKPTMSGAREMDISGRMKTDAEAAMEDEE